MVTVGFYNKLIRIAFSYLISYVCHSVSKDLLQDGTSLLPNMVENAIVYFRIGWVYRFFLFSFFWDIVSFFGGTPHMNAKRFGNLVTRRHTWKLFLKIFFNGGRRIAVHWSWLNFIFTRSGNTKLPYFNMQGRFLPNLESL